MPGDSLRRVWKINLGTMPLKEADEYITKLMADYRAKKVGITVDPDTFQPKLGDLPIEAIQDASVNGEPVVFEEYTSGPIEK